jgi:DNA/RNA endonuclease G (NUC1)
MKNNSRRRSSAILCLLALVFTQTFFQLAVPSVYADTGTGSVSLTTLGSPVTQDFNTLSNTAGSTTNSTLPTGWYLTETGGGARDNEQYAVDTGGSNTGDTYSYGAAASTDRAFGGLRSGTLIPVFGAQFTNNTGATITSLEIAYTGEEWRLGTAARTDQIDFQISTNATNLSTGTYTDVNALDFVTPNTVTAGAKDGNAAANRTALTSTIGSLSIPNGASFFIRWTDLDASGADDGLSFDDFSITPQGGGGGTSLSGVGSANPSTVLAGAATLLTVTVTPATVPDSTGIGVVGDLSMIGGTSNQAFFDNGTNGDVTGGDNIFSYSATVSAGTSAGAKTLPTIVSDSQGRTANANISLTVNSSSTSPSVTGSANPSSVLAGGSTLLTATVTPGTNPTSTGLAVAANLTSIGGSAAQTLFDDGTNGDVTIGDNIFSYNAVVAAATSPGAKSLALTVTDAQTRTGNGTINLTVTSVPGTGQPLPFSQNWSNTGLITVNNNWSGVPGIVGYLGDYDGGAPTAVDPQTLTQDFSATTVSVVANQPDTSSTSGGVGEFEITNPAVGFQGSGTADAPHLLISLNTTGASNIAVTYNLRDIDGTADNSVQPVALQYRIGSSGSFINIPGAFVADASSGPSLATLVTPVGVLLPPAAENQALVQLRIITTNAVGSDEWIGVDDILVESNGTLPLSASGTASPSNIEAGNSTLLTVNVNPATNPTSTGIAVTGDLSSIGGSPTQAFFNDGTNGDAVAGDNIFSYTASVPIATSSGSKSLAVTVTDAQARMAATTIGLLVSAATDPSLHTTMGNPSGATTDVNNPLNYLLPKNQYVMSYNRDRGSPNWVSWHLDSSWIGSAPRQDDFRPDPSLPAGWYQVTEFDYSGSGFDRGHHTPSGDRTRSIPDNSATFFMTNMMAQAPNNNQGPWEEFESFARTVAGQNNEMYIIAGGTGTGGTGSNGFATTIANGHVTVPAYTWKVMIVLPSGDNDVSRVTTSTRTIAVIMPNIQGIDADPWQKYLATVDQVEALTGYDFFSNVSPSIQNVIEAQLDPASNTSPQSIAGGTYGDLSINAPVTTLTGNVTVTGTLTLGGSYVITGGNRIILGPNATVNRISGKVIGSVEKQFDSLASPNFEYPVGTDNGYSPLRLQLTALGGPSSLTVRAVQGAHPNSPNPNVALMRYWDLTENGDLTGTLIFSYLDQDRPATVPNEATFNLQRFDGNLFSPVPSTIHIFQNTLTTNAPIGDFSDWTAFGSLVPTAAFATVSGRVLTSAGIGLPRARVTLMDGEGNVRTAITSPFGYYRFDGIQAGQSYVASVAARGHTFQPQIINVGDSVTDVDFHEGGSLR